MMLGRLFGKSKDASDEPVCYQCGRTLLAGEWTEKVEGPDGEERLLCSLCGQVGPSSGGERLKVGNGGANAARLDDDAAPAAEQPAQRGENEALWKAIKDRDAQIDALTERLAQSEAERQELIGRLALLQAQAAAAEAAGAEAVGEAAAATNAVAADDGATEPAAEGDAGQLPLEDTGEMPAVETEAEAAEDERLAGAGSADDEPAMGDVEADVEAADEPPGEAETTLETSAADAAAAWSATEEAAPDTSEAEAQAASMTLLQRGVDLLNVSPVPRKIADTNADLGIPNVHVGFDGTVAAVTFMWSMGWYRFTVDIESGSVRLGDRGYEDRTDLQPNATIRADGTVHLAAARISRAAAQRQHDDAAVAPAADKAASEAPVEAPVETPVEAPAEPAPPSGGPEILSKSLLGQRTDDERPSWEQTQARDFDWER